MVIHESSDFNGTSSDNELNSTVKLKDHSHILRMLNSRDDVDKRLIDGFKITQLYKKGKSVLDESESKHLSGR